MYVVTVEFIVKPEHTGEFQARVLKQATDSLSNEDKCYVFDVCRDLERAERFFLVSCYSRCVFAL